MPQIVPDGALVPVDPADVRLFSFDWDTENLAESASIASSVMTVIGLGAHALAVSSITRSGTTATVTTASAHGLSTGDAATIAGANQADYNITATVTVTSTTTFTYTVANSPTTPATGTITASTGLGFDNAAVGNSDIVIDGVTLSAGRYTTLRLSAGGSAALGKRFEVANKITTNETPAQTKERSFTVVIQNL